MRTLAIAILATGVVAMSSTAFAETVVIKRDGPGHSSFGHQQWRHGQAVGHRKVVIRSHSDEMRTGTVVKKKVIHRTDGMGGRTTTVIKRTTSDD